MSDYEQFVEDLDKLIDIAQAAHPGLPTLLLGHSAGGVLSAIFASGVSTRPSFWPSHVVFDAHTQQLFFAGRAGESRCVVTANNYVYGLSHCLVSADYTDVSPGSQHSVNDNP